MSRTIAEHAAVIRTRADRAIAHLRAHRDLLRRHGVNVDSDTALIARLADAAIADGRRAYDFAIVGAIASTISRTGDRVNGTRTSGPRYRRTVEFRNLDDTGDGDRLVTIAINLQAIDTDRPDSDLFPV